jgi:hypothetical protein
MNIYAKQGHKVIVTKESINNGNEPEAELANKYLKVGGKYTIQSTKVDGWHTVVYIQEIPNIGFNSVNFIDAQ